MKLEDNLLHTDEIEKSVLGAISVDNNIFPQIAEIVQSDMFTNLAHKEVFISMTDLYDKGVAIDDVSIFENIVNRGLADKVGAYDVSNALPYTHSSKGVYYATGMYERDAKRKLGSIGKEIITKSKNNEIESSDIIGSAVSELEGISKHESTASVQSFSQILDDIYEKLDNHKDGELVGVPSGLKALDDVTGGFQEGNLIVIAGRAGMGKSAFLGTIINNAASMGFPCALFSLEMDNAEVGARLSSIYTQFSVQDITQRRLFADQKEYFKKRMDEFRDLPIYVGDSTSMMIESLKIQARNLVKNKGVKLIAIDYLQLMKSTASNRQEQVSEVSRSLKNLAKELSVPVLALSQLSRAVEHRDNPRPLMSDLRESGSIEQDANLIIFLFRNEYYANIRNEEVYEEDKGSALAIIGKNRNGELADVPLQFIGEYSYFKDIELKL